jgi:hypothetical protein
MKLKEAISKLKEGQFIVHNNDWTEYSQQLHLAQGKLCWTAGFTVGGECCADRLASIEGQGEREEFQIYDTWGGRGE